MLKVSGLWMTIPVKRRPKGEEEAEDHGSLQPVPGPFVDAVHIDLVDCCCFMAALATTGNGSQQCVNADAKSDTQEG